MDDPISPEVFEHLVNLAELDLSPQEADYLRRELNSQLKSIRELEAIPLDENVPISLHGVPYAPADRFSLRADEWKPCQDAAAIINQAPQAEEGYIVVPDIPHTTLG
jgi:aspartyl-tRNA(Asn)/glutamyl-tRNA(Gln) amidotransferase subunit C